MDRLVPFERLQDDYYIGDSVRDGMGAADSEDERYGYCRFPTTVSSYSNPSQLGRRGAEDAQADRRLRAGPRSGRFEYF